MILAGSALYAAGMNLFILPLHLYSGGAVGLAQLLELALKAVLTSSSGKVNWYGILYFLINIPPLLCAWKYMGKNFLVRTIEGILFISAFMAFLPVPAAPVLNETLASALMGGVISGCGIGWVLTAGGSGGGLDVIGILAARSLPHFSVGKLSILFNGALFAVYVLLFDVSIALYSLIFMVFYSISLDRTHFQNINVRLMIFTKKNGIDLDILRKTARGVTEWQGIGAYTGEPENILVTVINKYEIGTFLDIIHQTDPNAFVIRDDGVAVSGNFEKRL